jgi:hypothetical protein
MSVGPLTSAAGLPLAQIKGGEVDRSHHDIGAQHRHVYHAQKAEAAAGIGQPDGEDHETADRDADGRLPWEPTEQEAADEAIPPRQTKDATGQSGGLLDVSG